MALTLTIGGVNFLPQYITGTARITEQLQNRANTMSMRLKKTGAQTKPQEGAEIIFKDGSRFLFGGFVTRVTPQETGIGQMFSYEIEATDYTYILLNHNAQEVYENMTMSAIVNDLFTNYVSSYSLDVTNVDTGPTVEKIVFNHISLRKCFEKLANYAIGFEWWIDYERKVYFKQREAIAAPESITDSSTNFSNINIQIDATQVKNTIVVRGGRQETTSSIVEELKGNGTDKKFILREKPKTMVSIRLNTGSGYTAQTYGVDPLDNDIEATKNFMFNFQEKFVRCSSSQSAPGATHVLEVTYYYEVPIIVVVSDAVAIGYMKDIEGGDGIHDFTIFDSNIKSKEEARNRALREIAEFGYPLINATFETSSGLLTAGSYFHPGQLAKLNLPSWGISTDSYYLVQEVTTTMLEDNSYHYSVRVGGRKVDMVSFLESLAGKEENVDADEDLDTIRAVPNIPAMVETIARNPMTRSIPEIPALVETIVSTNVTPPFKYGPSATNLGRYNAAEYG